VEVTNVESGVKQNLNDEGQEVNCLNMLAGHPNYLILELASVIDIIRNLMILRVATLPFRNLQAVSCSNYYKCLNPRKGECSHLFLPWRVSICFDHCLLHMTDSFNLSCSLGVVHSSHRKDPEEQVVVDSRS